jgi:large subunit ribosomal protein L3
MSNMRPGLLGRKVGMTQLFDASGDVVPVTVIELGPNHVVQLKTTDGKDGYNAVQLGFGTQKPSRLTKAVKGHLEKAGLSGIRLLQEIRLFPEGLALYPAGQEVRLGSVFKPGDRVDVTGTSKGSGTSGVMKRFHFAGFERSHGTHEFFRHGGSIGTRLTPGMTMKGMRMPGHLGNERVTVQNLHVYKIDEEQNLAFLTGGVPGPVGANVLVRLAARNTRVRKKD